LYGFIHKQKQKKVVKVKSEQKSLFFLIFVSYFFEKDKKGPFPKKLLVSGETKD